MKEESISEDNLLTASTELKTNENQTYQRRIIATCHCYSPNFLSTTQRVGSLDIISLAKRLTVTAAIIYKADHLLITQRTHPERLAGLWEFPGGKVEEGESLEACLVREITEELELKITDPNPFVVVEHDYGDFEIELHSFTANYDSGEIVLHSHKNAEWISVNQLTQYEFAPADKPIVQKLIKETNR